MEEPLQPKRQRTAVSDGGSSSSSILGSGGAQWEELNSEMLALIFARIQPADELLRVVPFVCKSWEEVVVGPYCWSEIDVERWCRRCNLQGRIDGIVCKLVRRSNGCCRRLCAYRLSDSSFSFVCNWVKGLRVLQMPMSDISDTMVKLHVESLKELTFLDISYCLKITCKGLEAVGKHCTSLVHLRRNMPPPEWQRDTGTLAKKKDENEEALIIADTMPRLRQLELGYGSFTDAGVEAILTKCKNLTHLDIIGCNNVKLEGDDFEDKCSQLVVFRPPWDDEYQDLNESESSDDDDFSDSTSD